MNRPPQVFTPCNDDGKLCVTMCGIGEDSEGASHTRCSTSRRRASSLRNATDVDCWSVASQSRVVCKQRRKAPVMEPYPPQSYGDLKIC
ncbi:unnamed protein product [Danaus chrysippus]|uniref:(African queen) hypothetical protein n=1 Tax=Danaus chrysippus TaxID=151541 RepID=A0A8J2R7U5_9NEOP|nr:unnamed protein product [Danaus chrysippus]